jgi:hypothetical protein
MGIPRLEGRRPSEHEKTRKSLDKKNFFPFFSSKIYYNHYDESSN